MHSIQAFLAVRGFHNSYPSGSTFRCASYITERMASECALTREESTPSVRPVFLRPLQELLRRMKLSHELVGWSGKYLNWTNCGVDWVAS